MKRNVDTLIYNARIHTLDEAGTVADAMVVHTGKIMETGVFADLNSRYKTIHQIDFQARPVFPGFIDAHCHFYGLALNLQWIDLVGCRSFKEVIGRIGRADTVDVNGWITGRGWDQNLWAEKEFPTREALDQRWPDRPVVLVRIDGHAVLANREALKRAGFINSQGFSPGEVELKNGKLTGILFENAADHMRSAIPKPDPDVLLGLFKEAEGICFASGLTGVSDAGLENSILHLMDSALQTGQLKIHLYAMAEPSPSNLHEYVMNGPYRNDRFHVGSVKMYADGSLGSRTAWLKQPYSDDPSNRGIEVSSPDSIRAVCSLAFDHDLQVSIHCIGDQAVHEVLSIYGEFLQGENDRRWRIEHAQVVDPADLILFKTYSVVPSVQATHATSDMYWAADRLGPVRIGWAYAYKDLLKQNGWLANGTDFPIERVNPLLTFYAAVARQDLAGFPTDGFQPENGLTREEAIRSMTIWAARASFEEDLRGSLEPGKWADFVVLEKDIMEIPLTEIPDVKVVETWLQGENVFSIAE